MSRCAHKAYTAATIPARRHAKEIDCNEDNPYLWYRRAQIAVARGDGRQADLLLDKVLELDAAQDLALLRGQSAWLQGNITLAQQMLQQAFEQANEGDCSAMRRELEQLFDEYPELPWKDALRATLMNFEN